LQEPRRMFRRYFIEDITFAWMLLKELAGRERKGPQQK
jgi:N-acetylglucosaminyldiphosphoundecaprenol N-acetyl-beta-D-mannosaminyltransferase